MYVGVDLGLVTVFSSHKITSMDIHQLSLNYQQEHDRILMRINTTAGEELRLWFTRRLSLGLLPLLAKTVAEQVARLDAAKPGHISPSAMADAQTKQMLAEFKREESLQKADFQTPYNEQPAKLPLGAEPLLVTEVNITPLPTGQLQLKFNEIVPGAGAPRGFQVSLEQNLVHGFLHLLDKAVQTSQWTQAVGMAMPVLTDSLPGADLTANARPKYLN